ncbi:TOMM precursor leader peptide-binding protein [Xanthomonas albilineans]|uniref:TOMM precursor leader peptide-binding protein n=1 Tax=Xanthomonas albilineans TaxID=29447 RepID=UPI0005F30CEE|nr:TOMM precursor leader peptide-binding protein [Xanthomonas albilineans]
MNQLLDSGLSLRRDALYFKTEKGISFRTRRSTFVLSSAGMYATFQQIVPFLDGRRTGAAIVSTVREEHRQTLQNLLSVLVKNEVVRLVDLQDTQVLEPHVARAFDAQLQFIGHLVDAPYARFARWRDSTVVLAGEGAAALGCGVALLRNGLRRLHVPAADMALRAALAEQAHALSAGGVPCDVEGYETMPAADLVVFCSATPSWPALLRLNAAATAGGTPLLPAVVQGGASLVGPLVTAQPGSESEACWTCAMLRWSDQRPDAAAAAFWRQVALDTDDSRQMPPESLAIIMANTAAMEAFKVLLGLPQTETRSTLLRQDFDTYEIARQRLLPHPACPACGGRHPVRGDEPANPRAALELWDGLMNERFGLFTRFDDDDIEQLPLRAAAVCWGPTTQARVVYAFSRQASDEARQRALADACALRSAQALPAGPAPVAEPGSGTVVSGDRLWGWVGASPQTTKAWLPARDAHRGDRCWVPTAAVHPLYDTDSDFRTPKSGIAAALELADARRLSALHLFEQFALDEIAQGRLALRAWDGSGGNDAIAFLVGSIGDLGEPVPTVLLATLPCGVGIAAVQPESADTAPTDGLVIAAGTGTLQALERALELHTGRLQVQRHGRAWKPVRDTSWLTGLPLSLHSTGTPVAADDDDTSFEAWAARLGEEGHRLLQVDVTPRDVLATASFHVVRTLLVPAR